MAGGKRLWKRQVSTVATSINTCFSRLSWPGRFARNRHNQARSGSSPRENVKGGFPHGAPGCLPPKSLAPLRSTLRIPVPKNSASAIAPSVSIKFVRAHTQKMAHRTVSTEPTLRVWPVCGPFKVDQGFTWAAVLIGSVLVSSATFSVTIPCVEGRRSAL